MTNTLMEGFLPFEHEPYFAFGREEVAGQQRDAYRRVRSWLIEQGRPDVPFTVFGADPDTLDADGYAEAGVDRIAFWVDPVDEAGVLRRLDAIAERRLR